MQKTKGIFLRAEEAPWTRSRTDCLHCLWLGTRYLRLSLCTCSCKHTPPTHTHSWGGGRYTHTCVHTTNIHPYLPHTTSHLSAVTLEFRCTIHGFLITASAPGPPPSLPPCAAAHYFHNLHLPPPSAICPAGCPLRLLASWGVNPHSSVFHYHPWSSLLLQRRALFLACPPLPVASRTPVRAT